MYNDKNKDKYNDKVKDKDNYKDNDIGGTKTNEMTMMMTWHGQRSSMAPWFHDP